MAYIKTVRGFCPIQKSNYSISATIVPNPTFDNPDFFEVGTIECTYARSKGCELLNAKECPLKNSIK